ncbi:MAG TPA: hypothetical protein VFX99_14125, partial [Microbacterium sp.]|nr:hypothetical protein [Microbacterium sp.]
LVALGEWSFAFYLIHATVIYTALTIFGFQPTRWMNLLWFGALLAVAIAGAAALHVWLERPVESKLRAAEVGWRMRREEHRQAKKAEAKTVALPGEATR